MLWAFPKWAEGKEGLPRSIGALEPACACPNSQIPPLRASRASTHFKTDLRAVREVRAQMSLGEGVPAGVSKPGPRGPASFAFSPPTARLDADKRLYRPIASAPGPRCAQ